MQIQKKIPFLLLLPAVILAMAWAVFPGSASPPGGYEADEGTAEEPVVEATAVETASVSLEHLTSGLGELGPINSIVISQNGEIVSETYFRGMNPGRAHNVKSVSKSILSILTGIAIDHGYLESVDQTIGEFFPEYFGANPDPVKESVTIGDLLTMRAGFASTSGRNYGRWVTSRNWVRHVLDRPLAGEPGKDRIYSTGTTHLLAVVLARATGMNNRTFANRYLFEPLGIGIGGWDRDPQGYYLGGNNMALRPSDLVRIGQMMMNTGMYEGRRIVSAEWVVRSVEPVTGRNPDNEDYGYLWFRRMSGDYHMVYAWGNGGQYLKIVPELNAVIAVTSVNQNSGHTRRYRSELFSRIDSEIIPGLTSTVTW